MPGRGGGWGEWGRGEEEEEEAEGVLFISLPHKAFIIEGRQLETDSRSEPPGCESARSGTCNPLQICGNVFLSREQLGLWGRVEIKPTNKTNNRFAK